jgi:hypothetical protein
VTNLTTWLVYSATNGTLSGHTGTNITFSIGSVANGFPRGPHLDTISFRDTTRNIVFDTRDATLQVGIGFTDDFCIAPYVNGNLAGQQSWYEPITGLVQPIKVNACKAWNTPVPTGGNDGSFADAAKDFGSVAMSSNDVFAGIVIVVTNASSVATPSYNVALSVFPGDNGGFSPNFRNYRFNAQDTGTGTYHFGARANGFAPGPTYGAALTYGTPYNVIIRAHAGGTNMTVYVNPTSAVLGDQTAYTSNAMTGGFPATLGAFAMSQFHGNDGNQAGVGIGRVSISTNYANVYTEITGGGGPADPYTTWATFYGLSGGNALGTADPDGDGMSNTNEFLAGFNPTSGAAYLHILSIAKAQGTNVTITYLGASGDSNGSPGPKTNVLESTLGTPPSYTNNFVSTGQTNILSGGTGLGTTATFVHTNGASGPARYYRVRVLVP